MFLLLLTLVVGVFVGQHVQISFTQESQSLFSSAIAQGKAQLPQVIAAAQTFSSRAQTKALSSFSADR